jgi:hypothetical protein
MRKMSFEEVPDLRIILQARQQMEPKRTSSPGSISAPFVWFRQHIRLKQNHDPLFLMIELPPSQNGSSSAELISL